jgi:hypothetical protein
LRQDWISRLFLFVKGRGKIVFDKNSCIKKFSQFSRSFQKQATCVVRITFFHIALVATIFLAILRPSQAFMPKRCFCTSIHTDYSISRLHAGFGVKSKSKSNKKKKSTKQQSPFDVIASTSRLEKRYDELILASAKQLAKSNNDEDPRWASDSDEGEKITSEYMITARASSKVGIDDWCPIGQLCVTVPESEYAENSKDVAQAAISSYCREISHMASMGAPKFSAVARNDMQYGVEPVDSFYKYVYSVVEEGDDKGMSKAKAREILGLGDKTSDRTTIKQAYRKLSFHLHPDRLDESSTTDLDFQTIQLAYEVLTSGIREEGKSWYESLGGRARTDFHIVNLLPLSQAQRYMEEKRIQGAIAGLERDLVQRFVARNLRSQ